MKADLITTEKRARHKQQLAFLAKQQMLVHLWHFFVHFFAVTARLRRENACIVSGWVETKT